MDLHKIIQTGEGIEDLEQNLLDLDSEFRFKCWRCGKCCIHQDTINLTAQDIFNIAKKQGRTTEEVIKAYTEVYIGDNSRIPVVHLLSNGPKGACPLMVDGRCGVHDCKPTVCALFPLGRVAIHPRREDGSLDLDQFQIRYVLNDYTCGSAKRVNTVRSWLARFGIAEQDEFFMLWTKTIAGLSPMVRKMEQQNVSEETLSMFWETMLAVLYIDYDVGQDFFPQFQARADKLLRLAGEIKKIPIRRKEQQRNELKRDGRQQPNAGGHSPENEKHQL